MSGHSKWSTIKRKKADIDSKRGKLFTKIIKEITVAAKTGGGVPESNPQLRTAILAAKEVNMPKDNIEKAIKRGTGELEGVSYEEIIYEGYGPGGAAVLVHSLTDNRNRAASDIRNIFTKCNGALGEAGCVGWLFQRKGFITVPANGVEESKLFDLVIEAGAEDMKLDDDSAYFEILSSPSDFENVKQILSENKITFDSAEVTMLPQNTIKLTGKDAENMLKLMDTLEDCDDVQKVYSNFDIDDTFLEQFSK